MTPSAERLPPLDEFKRLSQERAQEELRYLRKKRRKGIPDEALLWLALSPGWTWPLALACDFPGVQSYGPQKLFERLLEENLVRAYPLSDNVSREGNKFYYSMTPEARSEILQEQLTGDPTDALKKRGSGISQGEKDDAIRELLDLTAEIAKNMQDQIEALDYLPAALKRWVDLAIYASNSKQLVLTFSKFVREAYADRDLTAIQDWTQAARWLIPLFSEMLNLDLHLAIIQAGRFMELIRRRSHDAVHLAHFWHRDDQIQAVRQLMDGPDHAWALHFIGPGGVGKTTLIRYITCMVNAVQGDPCYGDQPLFDTELALARIDFDFLNPDFPRLHPGLLLNALAQELRAYAPASSSADKHFNRAEEIFEELHQTLKSRGYHPDQPPTSDPNFQRGMRYYIDALRALGKRVLIILDTCEELEKATPLNIPNANVRETFRILRALHDGPETLVNEHAETRNGLLDLRVILSGRRLLAGSGMGWSSPNTRQPHRSFLRLFSVRGFTLAEASAYLAQEQVPEDLIPAVIQASSPDAGSAVRFEIDAQQGDGDDIQRCNPYKLNDFMSWALEESPPSPQQLLEARGSYTQMRIVERLRDPLVKDILPVVVWLGHFDQELLGVATGLSGNELVTAFGRLQEQEWINRPRGMEITRPILSLHKNTRDQLYVYYTAGEDDIVTSETRRRVQAYMRNWMLGKDLGQLEWTDYDAALNVFEADFEIGAEWWQLVEARLFTERDSQYILETLSILSGKDGSVCLRPHDANPDVPAENRLRSLVLATMAATHLQLNDLAPLAELWDEVISKTQKMVLNGGAQAAWNLYRRALAGRAALSRYNQLSPDYLLLGWFWEAWAKVGVDDLADPQLAAAWIAGCEGLVETLENQVGDPYGLNLRLITQVDASSVVRALGRAASNLNSQGRPEAEQLLTWAEQLAGQKLIVSDHFYVVRILAENFWEMGQIDRAYEIVNTLPDPYYRCRTLCSLATTWTLQENGKQSRFQAAQQARLLAQRLSTFSHRAVKALCKVADALHEVEEDQVVVHQVLQEAEEIALKLQDEDERAASLSDVIRVYEYLEKSEQGLEVSESLLVALIKSPSIQAQKRAANYLASHGQADTALELARQIQDAGSRAEVLSRVVDGLVAKDSFTAALETVEQISDLSLRWRARLRVLQQLRWAGKNQENENWLKQASDLLDDCLAELSQIADPIERDDLIAEVADDVLEAGQKERLLALAVGMRSDSALDRVWEMLAYEESEGGNFAAGLQYAHRMADSSQQLMLLSELYLKAPESDAPQLLAECLELAQDLSSRATSASGLRLLVNRLSEARETWLVVEELPPEAGQSLLAYAYSLAARGLTLVGDRSSARDMWNTAITNLPVALLPRNLWRDWRPPPDLTIRLQMNLARTAYPALFSPLETLQVLDALPIKRGVWQEVFSKEDIEVLELDSDRLNSVRLALRLATGLVAAEDLVELGWASSDGLTPIYHEDIEGSKTKGVADARDSFESSETRLWLTPGDCNAQRKIPPLLVTACQVWWSLGQLDFATRQLRYLANDYNFDLQVREHAERALLEMIRHARLFEIGEETDTSLQDALNINDLGLVWSVQALSGQRRAQDVWSEAPKLINNTWALSLHHAWRSLPAALAIDQALCIEFGLGMLTQLLVEGQVNPNVDYAFAALALDLREIRQMAVRQGGQLVIQNSSLMERDVAVPSQRSVLGLDGEPLWHVQVEYRDQDAIWYVNLSPETFRYSLDVSTWAMTHPMEPECALRLLGRQLALSEIESYSLDDIPDGMLSRLGIRSAGQILYEEAEMLAQRLPGAASGLFGLAKECFHQAHDLQGQFMAAISQALASACEGSMAGVDAVWAEGLSHSLEIASPLYEALRQNPGLKELPTWNKLKRLAAKPRRRRLKNLSPPSWKPWLARGVACLSRQQQLSGKNINLSGLQEWLSDRYGVERIELESRLPREWLAFYEAPKESRTLTYVSMIIGLLSMLACCIGGFFLFRNLAGFSGQASMLSQIAWYAGLVFVVLMLIGLGSFAWDWYRRRRSFLEMALSLQMPDQFKNLIVEPGAIYSEQRPLPFEATLTHWSPRWRLGWPPVHPFGKPILSPFEGQTTFVQPYAELGTLLSETLLQQLRTLLQVNQNNPNRVALSIADGLHGLAWEALLVYSLSDNDKYNTPLSLPLRFERVPGEYSLPKPLRGPLQIASLVGGMVTEDVAKAGGQGLVSSPDFVWLVNPENSSERENAWGVHIIGSVQVSYNRLGIRLESGYDFSIGSSEVRKSADGARLLTAGELRRILPQMRFCILQNLVSSLEDSRMETERLDASLVRIFADQIARSGAAVLVLPPLPASLASRALGMATAAIPKTPRQKSAALRQAVAEIQEMLINEIPEHAMAWEVALDVCLYVPERWQVR